MRKLFNVEWGYRIDDKKLLTRIEIYGKTENLDVGEFRDFEIAKYEHDTNTVLGTQSRMIDAPGVLPAEAESYLRAKASFSTMDFEKEVLFTLIDGTPEAYFLYLSTLNEEPEFDYEPNNVLRTACDDIIFRMKVDNTLMYFSYWFMEPLAKWDVFKRYFDDINRPDLERNFKEMLEEDDYWGCHFCTGKEIFDDHNHYAYFFQREINLKAPGKWVSGTP